MLLRRRHILLAFLALASLFVTFAAFEITWAMTAKSDRTFDYGAKASELVAARQLGDSTDPTQPNRWPDFIAAVRAFYVAFDKVQLGGTQPPTYPTSAAWPADFDALRACTAASDVVASSEATIALIAADPTADFGPRLDALAAANFFVRPLGGSAQPLIATLLPELGESRLLFRHELLMLQRAYRAREPRAVQAHLQRGLLIARVLGRQGFLIDQAVSDALLHTTFDELSALIIERPPNAAMIDAMQAALSAQFPGFEVPRCFADAEKLTMLDTIQRGFDSSGYGRGRLIVSDFSNNAFLGQAATIGLPLFPGNSRLQNLLWFRFASRAQTEAKVEEYHSLINTHITAAPGTRKNLPNTDAFIQNLSPRFVVIHFLAPAVGSAIAKSNVSIAQLRALRIILAIERYRLTRNQPPGSLAELVPEFLEALPADTMSDSPFLYKRLASPDTHGRSYILYLPGLDEIDNGGVETLLPAAATATTPAIAGTPPNQPYISVLNTGASPGLDFILTRPRPTPTK